MTTEELINTLKKNPLLTVCGALSLALAVGLYFRWTAVPDANGELEKQSTLARRHALNIANGAQLKEHLEALTKANQMAESRLIRATDIGINQQYFYKLESESGVKLTDLRQGRQGPAKGGFAPINFTVVLDGDFTQVLTFLRTLEDRTHYCRILTASLSGGRSGTLTLSLNLELLGRP